MEPTQLDRTHHFMPETFVEREHAPHYTEIARRFGVAAEEGKKLLHDLMSTELTFWTYPGTDLIASFAPFSTTCRTSTGSASTACVGYRVHPALRWSHTASR